MSEPGDLTVGLTLRDYFAGQAIVPIVTGADPATWDPELLAVYAYQVADALLAVRGAPEEAS